MDELSLSQVNIPISLKIKEIEATINDQIDGVLYENVDLAEDSDNDLQIRAEKAEAISISFDSNQINYRIPLKLWIKKVIPITKLEMEVEGAIALSISTEFKIGTDWKLTTHTNIIDHEWLLKPQIRLGLFDLSIKFILNTILKKSKNLICAKLDKELAKNFDLRKTVKEAWKTLQNPILIAEEFGLWIEVYPKKVGMTPLISDGEILKSTVMVQTLANASIGEKPQTGEEVPLPPFQWSADIGDDFVLHLKTDVAYKEAERIVKKYLVGHEISQSFFKAKVVDVNLRGIEDKMSIQARLSGTYNGLLIFEGKPVFFQEKNKIEIKEPDYQLKTRNIFIRFMNWLFHGIFKRRLQKQLRFPLSESLSEIIKKVSEVLENYEVADNVFLNGKLCKLEVNDIQTAEKGMTFSISTTGKLNLLVNKIEVNKLSEN